MPAPTISTVVPDHGPAGTPIVVTGTNFLGVTAMRIGGASVPFLAVSSTEIDFTLPRGLTLGPDDIDLDWVDTFTDPGAFTDTAPTGSKTIYPGFQMRGPTMPPSPTYDDVIHGVIGECPWSALEASPGGYADASASTAHAIATWNTGHPTHKRMVIARMDANIRTPAWLQSGSGGGVSVSSPGAAGPPQHGNDSRWWTTYMQHRHDLLMAYFGPKVDSHPEITRVTVCGPDEIYDEIFVRFSGNAAALAAAGLVVGSGSNDEAAFTTYINQTCAHLTNTAVMMDVSQYQGSLTFTEAMINHLISVAPAGVVLAQASINATNALTDPVFAMMKTYGPLGSHQCKLRMQMEPGVTAAQFPSVAEAAIGYGVSEMEVASSYTGVSHATLATLDAGLIANA